MCFAGGDGRGGVAESDVRKAFDLTRRVARVGTRVDAGRAELPMMPPAPAPVAKATGTTTYCTLPLPSINLISSTITLTSVIILIPSTPSSHPSLHSYHTSLSSSLLSSNHLLILS